MNLVNRTRRLLSVVLMAVLLVTGVTVIAPTASADTYYNSGNAIAYDQRDSAWGGYYIGGGSIYDTACGIVSSCNAINYLTGAFSNKDSAKNFILDWGNKAHNIGGFNPGSSADGGYRYIMFGQDYSTTPPLATNYGSTYGFDMPITWTENWNSANYYSGSYWNNIYVSSQTALKNYLAGDAVAIAHVPFHFICLADYDPATDRFLVLDSYPTAARQTGNGVCWMTSAQRSGGLASMTVGGFCVLRSTAPSVKYPIKNDDGSLTLHDGESTSGLTSAFNTTIYKDTGTVKSGKGSIRMRCTNPAAQSGSTKIGGMAIQTLSSTSNLSSYDTLEFDILFSRDMTGSNGFQVNFATSGQDGYNHMFTINDRKASAGWHHMTVDLANIGKAADADWTKINTIRYTWFNYAGTATETNIYLDNVKLTKKGGSTPTVTYPYKNTDGTLTLHDGETTGGLTASYDTNIARDTSKKTTGSSSIRMQCTKPGAQSGSNKIAGMMIQKLNATTDLSKYSIIEFDLQFSRDMTGSNGFQINFATNGQDGYNQMVVINDKKAGEWHHIALDMTKISKVADDADWSKINNIRYTWFNYSGNSTETAIYVDNVIASGAKKEIVYPYVQDDYTLMLYDAESLSTIRSDFKTDFGLIGTKTQGENSLRMTCTDPDMYTDSSKVGGMIHHTFTTPADLTNYEYVGFDLYLTEDLMGSSSFQLNFGTNSEDGYNHGYPLTDKKVGWYYVEVKRSDISKVKDTADWSNITNLRLTWFNYKPFTTETTFYIDNIRAYNKAPEVDHAVVEVINAIDALPAVSELKKSDEAEIVSVVNKYNALSNDQRTQVTNLQKLLDVVNGFNAMMAQEAIDAINALPQASQITGADRTAIKNAEAIYNGLDKEQVALVTNKDKLDAALAALEQWETNAVQQVITAIDGLPQPTEVTDDDVEAVQTVAGQFSDLPDHLKEKVTNKAKLDDLLAAIGQLPQKPTVLYGDTDLNGVIAAADALEVLKSVVGKVTLTDEQKLAADVDGNQVISAADALMILQKVVGKISQFPVEQ